MDGRHMTRAIARSRNNILAVTSYDQTSTGSDKRKDEISLSRQRGSLRPKQEPRALVEGATSARKANLMSDTICDDIKHAYIMLL